MADAVRKNELASQQLDNAACESHFSHERVTGAAGEKQSARQRTDSAIWEDE